MQNEKVIQIVSLEKDIYGLSESGKLVFFDKNSSMFVVRSNGEIKDVASNNILKCQQAPIVMPLGVYRSPTEMPGNGPIDVDFDAKLLELSWYVGFVAIIALVSFALFKIFS